MAVSRSILGLVALLLWTAAQAQVGFATKNFNGQFADGSGVLQSLVVNGFDFSPSDVFNQRNGANNYHTGDLNLRFRTAGASSWTDARTAAQRDVSLTGGGASDSALLTSNLGAALTSAEQSLNVTRVWSNYAGDLALTFTLSNVARDGVELGAIGFPVEFNNVFTGRMAVDTTNVCVLVDPYIGLDAGYVQASRLTGTGPDLVITPLNSTKFEGWGFLAENRSGPLYYQSQTFEGNYEWLTYSQAYAEQEWNATEPWNTPTSLVLAPGDSATFGLRFSSVPSLPEIEDAVSSNGIPVAVGVPGYIIPGDSIGSLYLSHTSAVSAVAVDPPNAISFTASSASLPAPWVGYQIQPSTGMFGRVKATVTYEDGLNQTVHYHVSKSAPQALSDLGNFAATRQFFDDTSDPFHRAPSIISYDRSTDTFDLQDTRAWIAGLSDEGGAGSFVAASMKQTASPVPSEVSLLEQFVDEVVWNYLQLPSGDDQYGVRKSLFFYEPNAVPGYEYDPDINFSGTWDREAAYLLNRAYDYVWVSELYWSLYTAEIVSPGILTIQNSTWYLNQAYQTVLYALNADNGVGYANLGLMGERVWGLLLEDLYIENMTAEADALSSILRARQQVWAGLPDPYGSEMAWDSTGQEGVYYWSAYFNDSVTADRTLASIRGYMPTIPHWGYNGNARRYWDFQYAGARPLARVERQIHHYGSGLNSPPLLDAFRANSDPSSIAALYDLRVGYGGHQGPLSNIQEDGMGSMAFHSYANTLRWDDYTGDYGPGFLGHVLASASYIVEHPVFGTIAFGGDVVAQRGGITTVQPKDSVRRRVYIAPVGLWVTLDAGAIKSIEYDGAAKSVSIDIGAKANEKKDIVMRYEQTAQIDGVGNVLLDTPRLISARGGYIVSVTEDATSTVTFRTH